MCARWWNIFFYILSGMLTSGTSVSIVLNVGSLFPLRYSLKSLMKYAPIVAKNKISDTCAVPKYPTEWCKKWISHTTRLSSGSNDSPPIKHNEIEWIYFSTSVCRLRYVQQFEDFNASRSAKKNLENWSTELRKS